MDQIHNINYPELAQEVIAKKEISPEVSPKEIISDILAKRGTRQPKESVPQPLNEGATPAKPVTSNLPKYADAQDPAVKSTVEHLITLTLHEGLDKGIEFARKEDPFVLDLYHDSLTDTLHEELIKRKLI
jgi:hypothetical protein